MSFTSDRTETTAQRTVLRVTRLVSLAEMEGFSEPWRALSRQSSAPLTWFQSYDWCKNWIAMHAGNDIQPHVLLLHRDDELRAILPLMVKRQRPGITVMRNLGEPHSQYANVLTADGRLDHAEIEVLSQALLHTPGADIVVISLVPTNSPLARILKPETSVAELTNEAAHLDLQEFRNPEDYRNRGNKRQRRSRKRKWEILEREGKISLRVFRPGSPQYAQHLGECVRLKENWLNRTGRISMGLEFADHAAFLSSIPTDTPANEGPYLFAMCVDCKPVAYEVGFLHKGHYYSYLGSFIWRYRDASPGALQIELAICWLIEYGVKAFDLLANPSEYKKRFTNRTIDLSGHTLPLSFKGSLYSLLWARTTRPIIKKLYHMVPVQLRISMIILRKLELTYSV